MSRGWLYGLTAVIASFLFVGGPARAEDPGPIQLDTPHDAVAYCNRVQAAFTREDFATLEATAARARTLETHFPGGRAELQIFYEALARDSCAGREISLTEESGKARTEIVEHWLGQSMNSPTARIAGAMIWTQLAGTARGNGYASQVSREQWAVFADRNRHAVRLIQDVDPTRDAQAYILFLSLAVDFGASRQQVDDVYRRAQAQFPSYLGYYGEYAIVLLPKWLGRPGEVYDYLNALLVHPGGDLGAIVYSFAAQRIVRDLNAAGDLYRDGRLSWNDIRRGYTLRESRDGLDKHAWTIFCYFAVKAGDRDTAREAFRHADPIEEWPDGGPSQFTLTALPWILG